MITVWITRDLDLVFREENSNIYHRTYYSRLRQKVGNKRYRINEKKLGRMKMFIARFHCFPPDIHSYLVVRIFDVLYFSDIKKLIEESDKALDI
jgi:hypothetical protein